MYAYAIYSISISVSTEGRGNQAASPTVPRLDSEISFSAISSKWNNEMEDCMNFWVSDIPRTNISPYWVWSAPDISPPRCIDNAERQQE